MSEADVSRTNKRYKVVWDFDHVLRGRCGGCMERLDELFARMKIRFKLQAVEN